MKKDNKKNSKKSVLLLLLLVLAISVGYAALTTTLKINGSATIKKASWDVHFVENSVNVNKSAGATATVEPAVSGNTTTQISYDVTLAEPGDFYEFTVDVKNAGSLAAKLSSTAATDIFKVRKVEEYNGTAWVDATETFDTAVQKYFSYSVIWYPQGETAPTFTGDGTNITDANKTLAANQTKTVKVRVYYDPSKIDEAGTNLPTVDKKFTINVELNFIQDK